MAAKATTIEVKPIVKKMASIRIIGDSPLIVHNWSTKAKKEMLDKQTNQTKRKPRDAKDPFADFFDSLYWMTEKPAEKTQEAFEEAVRNGAKFGFKASGIKQSANAGALRNGYVKDQMVLRGLWYVLPDDGELVEIKGCYPTLREDEVRVSGNADLRYRAEFTNWYMDLNIQYNANGLMTLEQIIQSVEAGGFSVGIGEWRPEKDGTYGMYHVERK